MPSLGDPIERRIAFIARLEPLIGTVAGLRVLDLGCGREGLWTRAYGVCGARVVAIELDQARCREAAAHLGRAERPRAGAALLVRGDGEHLPLTSASCGFIHCAQVLEHVRSPRVFLGELCRVLVPGGFCYLTAINRHALRDPHFGVVGVNYLPRGLADRVLAWMGAVNPEGQPLSAMHYFSRRSFRALCAASGLEMVGDLKRRERLARHGAVGGRLADLWGSAVRSAAFHLLVRRPVACSSGDVAAGRRVC
ncbi:MAG: class I SAM-dependent methyltransferase [Candidatus Binatia bacterium]